MLLMTNDKLFPLISLSPIFAHFVQYAWLTLSNFSSLCPIAFTSSNFGSLRPIWGDVIPELPFDSFQHLSLLTCYWPIVNILMDRFLKRSNPSSSTDVLPPAKKRKSASSKQGNISAKMRAAEYALNTFYCDAGRMFCKSCNVLVDHVRKSVVEMHVSSKVCL